MAAQSDLFQPGSNTAAMTPVSVPATTRALRLPQTQGAQNLPEISVNSYNFALTYIVIYQLSMHDYEFYEFGCM